MKSPGQSAARIQLRRAFAALDRNRPATAERLFRRVLAVLPRGRAGDELRLAAGSGLGNACRMLARYPEADRLFARALPLAERLHGRDADATRSVLNSWAVLHKYQGRFAEGARLYRRALRAALAEHGSEAHAEIATLYHNLGGLEHARGRHAAGEPFARKSVTLRRQLLSPGHPEVLADEAALAALLVGQGKHAEAERIYRRALRVFRRSYGPEHYEVAVTLNNLAALLATTGRPKAAERHYRQALALKEKLLGRSHLDVAITLNNLAVLLKSQPELAGSLCRRALAIFEAALHPRHPSVRACRRNLARLGNPAERGS